MKSFWKLFTGILSRVLYTFTWLIVLSIGIEELDVFPAIVAGFIIIAVFLLIHVKFLLPKKMGFRKNKICDTRKNLLPNPNRLNFSTW